MEIDLRVPGVTSLKGKRAVVKSLIGDLRRQLNVSVIELGYQEQYQRTVIGVTVAAASEHGVRTVIQQIEKIVFREPRVELIHLHTELAQTE